MKTLAGSLLGFLILCCQALAAPLHVWHTLTPHNQAVLEALVAQYNQSQTAVQVVLTGYGDAQSLEAALDKLKQTPKQRPHLVQLDATNARDGMPKRQDILPLHTLLRRYPIAHAQWFLPGQNAYARDAQGRLVAFPYMAEVPVMFYRPTAFTQAQLKPQPERDWAQLQGQLVALANKGSRQCPLISEQLVSVHLENLAALNLQHYTSDNNGIGAKAPARFLFDTLHVRHLSVMSTWVRSGLMVHPGFSAKAAEYFAAQECAVLLGHSGNLGRFLQEPTLQFAVSGLPYYAQVSKRPGNPFVSGSALWAVRGHAAAQDKATLSFLGWLAQPQVAAYWHQQTGFLPLTQAAFRTTPESYYQPLAQWHAIVGAYAKPPAPLNRGFRVNNYPRIRAMFAKTLHRTLLGEAPAATALKVASTAATKLMR